MNSESRIEWSEKMKSKHNNLVKYICTNCRVKQNPQRIRAMLKAGFGLSHLECAVCGQKTLAIKL